LGDGGIKGGDGRAWITVKGWRIKKKGVIAKQRDKRRHKRGNPFKAAKAELEQEKELLSGQYHKWTSGKEMKGSKEWGMAKLHSQFIHKEDQGELVLGNSIASSKWGKKLLGTGQHAHGRDRDQRR